MSKRAKHTPGPWRVGKRWGTVVADHPVPEVPGSDNVEAYGGHLVAESVSKANALLIAAAPAMYEAIAVDDIAGALRDVARAIRTKNWAILTDLSPGWFDTMADSLDTIIIDVRGEYT